VVLTGGYSFASDLWAAGCVLYEIICLKTTFPFVRDDHGVNWHSIKAKILKSKPDPLPPQRIEYRGELQDVVSAMLQKDVLKRSTLEVLQHHRIFECLLSVATTPVTSLGEDNGDMVMVPTG
jgi:serine/threonine protein kinase